MSSLWFTLGVVGALLLPVGQAIALPALPFATHVAVWVIYVALWAASWGWLHRARTPAERTAALRRWRQAAKKRRELGLLGGVPIELSVTRGDDGTSTILRFTFPEGGPLPKDTVIEPLGTRPGRLTTGDRAFDRRFRLSGPDRELLSFLTHRARQELSGVRTVLTRFTDRELVVEFDDRQSDPPEAHLKRLDELVRALVPKPGRSAADRYFAIASTDPVAEARLQAVITMATEFPNDPRWSEARDTLFNHEKVEVRALALEAFMDSSRREAFEFVRDQANGGQRARVLRTLLHHCDSDTERQAVARSLVKKLRRSGGNGSGDGAVRAMIVPLALRLNVPVDDDILSAAILDDGTGTEDILQWAATHLDAPGEQLALGLSSLSMSTKRLSARLLAKHGSIAQIPALEAMIEGRANHPLEKLAQQAIEHIRAGVDPTTRGGVSLQADANGGVALAGEQAGFAVVPAREVEPTS